MKKRFLLPLISLLLTAPAFGGQADEIHIVTTSWELLTNKDGTGLLFDIVRKIYEPAGIKMRYEFVPWKRAEYMIDSGSADAMLDVYEENIGKNMLRPEYPMIEEYTAAVFKKNRIKEWDGVKSLSGMRALWLRGYDFDKNPRLKDVKLKWDEIDDYDTAWRMLEKGRADVYLDAFADIQSYVRKNHIDMSSYRMETVFSDKGYMAFSKSEKSAKLVEIYDKRITELFKSGELKKVFEKWNYPFPSDAWKE